MGMQKTRYIILASLIIFPSIVALDVPLYNMTSPDLYGLPFFYWFQTLWLVVCTISYLGFSYLIDQRSKLK
ncbi:MAG: DUF3311 domain-containing protein [Nitrososphaerota archaeon]